MRAREKMRVSGARIVANVEEVRHAAALMLGDDTAPTLRADAAAIDCCR